MNLVLALKEKKEKNSEVSHTIEIIYRIEKEIEEKANSVIAYSYRYLLKLKSHH